MGYAFISYSSANRALTDKIKSIFEKNQIECWLAPDDIPIGSRYAKVINRAIKNCSCFILLLTKESMDSQWVAKEVERGIHYEKPMISIRLEEFALSDEFELYISSDQTLTLSAIEESEETSALIASVGGYNARSAYNKQMLKEELQRERNAGFSSRGGKGSAGRRLGIPLMICAILLALGIGSATLISHLAKIRSESAATPPGTTQTDQSSGAANEKEPATVPSTDEPADSPSEEPSSAKGENQIPAQFEQEITALKHSSALALSTATIRVKVGEYATPSAAITWTDCTIYSQDTAIAIGEGPLVKGVAKGETYIVVAVSERMCQPYYIIVE